MSSYLILRGGDYCDSATDSQSDCEYGPDVSNTNIIEEYYCLEVEFLWYTTKCCLMELLHVSAVVPPADIQDSNLHIYSVSRQCSHTGIVSRVQTASFIYP
jgi:hypothetical protein